MKNRLPFKVFYYSNNVTFSFLLFITVATAFLLIYGILQRAGVVSNSSNEIEISFNSIRNWLSTLGLTCCFYQTFLALYAVKQDQYSDIYWTKKFRNCAILLILLGAINLVMFVDKADDYRFLFVYGTEDGQYGIPTTPLFYFLSAVVAYFISSLKPQTK